jgi:HlyD family secretion protein
MRSPQTLSPIRLPPLPKAFHWPATDRRKLGALALLGVLSLLVGSVIVARRLRHEPPPHASSLTPSPQGISAIGRVEPSGEVIRVSAPALMEGAKVEQLLVALGAQVRAGQVIAVLDNHDRLRRALDLSKQQWNVARLKLKKEEAGAKSGDIQAQTSRIEQLRRELKGQIASQSLAIKRLDYEVNNAQTECTRYARLFSAGAVSASQKETICLLSDTTQQQRLEARAELQRTQQTLSQQIQEARSSRAAIAEVRPTDVSVARAEVDEALANVKQMEANLAQSIVRSPRDGQILRVITKEGEKVGDDGIVELGNTKQMMVVAEIYETDVHRVKVGQKATIYGQSLMQQLQGIVVEVGLRIGKKDLLGTDPAAASDARVVEVKINLKSEDSFKVKALTNLQVDVVIHDAPSLPAKKIAVD